MTSPDATAVLETTVEVAYGQQRWRDDQPPPAP